MGHASLTQLSSGTVVVIPSISFPVVELRKIAGAIHYEERMLFLTLLLRAPELRMVYATSLPLDEAVVDYYLRFTPDPADSRRRLHLLSIDDPNPRGLAEKLLDKPPALSKLRELAGDPAEAYVLTFNTTPAEAEVLDALDLPLYGPDPDLVALGSKSGSRRVGRKAGVSVLEGTEDVRSVAEIEAAINEIRDHHPGAQAVVIKLNYGFSGQGNAIVELGTRGDSRAELTKATTFCASEESWSSFVAKVEAEGAIVEELIRAPGLESPSVQLRITPVGDVEIISTHDQVLGGHGNHVYLGCRFPARSEYRAAIQDAARRVGEVLAGEGVIGSFGIDFLVVPDWGADAGADVEPQVFLSEINLRLGGTTHPFWMAKLAVEGDYDEASGELMAGGRRVFYVASDNIKSERLIGRSPSSVIEAVDRAGLAYDPSTRTGTTLHLLGPLRHHGKMGAMCIAAGLDEAQAMYDEVVALLTG